MRERESRVFKKKSYGLIYEFFGEFSELVGLLIRRESRVEVSINVGIAASKKADRRNRRKGCYVTVVGNEEDCVIGVDGGSLIRVFEVFWVRKMKELDRVTSVPNPPHR